MKLRGTRSNVSPWTMQQKPGAVDENIDAEITPDPEALPGHLGGEKPEEKVPPYAWFIVALLLALNIHNQWTRALLYYIVSFKVDVTPENARQYMNIDLGFGQEQYGLLASFGFTALYTLFTLVAGRAADGNNRAVVATIAAAGWSLTTLGQAFATSFESVLATRAITGVSQAFLTPPAYGLIASYVPESKLATANSVYASGIYVGGALASLSILLDNQLGWRGTSLVAGGIGLGIAGVSALALREKPKSEEEEAEEMSALLKKEASEEEMVVVVQGGEAKGGEAEPGGSGGHWGLARSGSGLRCSKRATRWERSRRWCSRRSFASSSRRRRRASARATGSGCGRRRSTGRRSRASPTSSPSPTPSSSPPAASSPPSSAATSPTSTPPRTPRSASGSPPSAACSQADTFEMSIGMLFCEYIVAECWFGPALASLYKGVPKDFRGTAQGLFTVLGAIGNVMPVLIGSLQSTNSDSLPAVLAWTVSGAYVLSGLGFFAASLYLPEPEKRAPAAEPEL